METIYKYPIKIIDEQIVTMTEGADILCVQIQNGMPCLWALVDPDIEETETVVIRTIGTGHKFSDGDSCLYIGTYQLPSLVFHVFRKM